MYTISPESAKKIWKNYDRMLYEYVIFKSGYRLTRIHLLGIMGFLNHNVCECMIFYGPEI